MGGLSGFPGVWNVVTLSAFRTWNPAPCLPSVNSCFSLELLLEVSATLALSLIYPSDYIYLMPALPQLLGIQRYEYIVSAMWGHTRETL